MKKWMILLNAALAQSFNTGFPGTPNACANLLLNNYQNYPFNLVNGKGSDDNTMKSVQPNPSNQSITLVASSPTSYYYETGLCKSARSEFKYFSFVLVPTAIETQFQINFKTASNCDQRPIDNYVSSKQLGINFASNQQNMITIPIPVSAQSNLVAIAIENVQPIGSAISFGSMTLSCVSGNSGPNNIPFPGGYGPSGNGASRLLTSIWIFLPVMQYMQYIF